MSQLQVDLAELTTNGPVVRPTHLSSGLKDPGSCLQRGGVGRLPFLHLLYQLAREPLAVTLNS